MKNCLLAVALATASTLAIAAPVDDAKALMARGDAAGAAALLEKTLDQHLADVDHNYLLGIALLDSGNPGAAVFAFERVLAIEPGHALARAELGRAMIALSEFDAARAELQQVRKGTIPPEVAAKVDAILADLDRAIAARAQASGAALVSGYIEGEFGYDSNINTATNSSSVVIPLFGLPATLTGFARAQSSWLLGLGGALSVQKRVAPDVDVYAGVEGRLRYYPNHESYAPVALSAGGGVRMTRGNDQYSVGLSQFTYYIGQFRNDDLLSIYAQWQHQIDQSNVLAVFGQYTRADHPIAPALNTDLYMVGGTWTHAFERQGDPRLTLSAWYGDDQERGTDPSVGRNILGAKVAGDYKLQEKTRLFGSLAVQGSRYGGVNPFFGVTRQDERYDLAIGASYKPEVRWTYSAQLLYTKNQSNIPINTFSREQILIAARRDF